MGAKNRLKHKKRKKGQHGSTWIKGVLNASQPRFKAVQTPGQTRSKQVWVRCMREACARICRADPGHRGTGRTTSSKHADPLKFLNV